jgi:hypothetical protein
MVRALAAICATLITTVAYGQAYPAKPIHMLVAFPPGGPVDIIARLVAPKMSETLGQPVIVENKVGASGNVATAEVAKSAPDGYTLLAHSSAYAVNPTLFSNPGYDPAKDLLPLAVVAQQANIVLVNASFPARTLEELKGAMQKGKTAFASPGAGTTPHLTAENLFHLRWKTDATHVPFKGAGPAVAGAPRRRAADRLHGGLGTDGEHQEREAARARRIVGEALAAASRRADAERARLYRHGGLHVGRHLRAGGHFARSRAEAERRGAQSGGESRPARAARCARF